MKTKYFVAATALLAVFVVAGFRSAPAPTPALTPVVPAGTYVLDQAHSKIGFKVRHLGISTVEGRFGEATATVAVPTGDLSSLQAQADIQVASIDTGNDDRDDHLRSPDFFDVATYPALRFESTGLTMNDEGAFTMTGNLTMRDVTQPVTLEGAFLGTAKDPWGNQKIAFTAEGEINREDFGLTWNKVLEAGGLLVGEKVTLVLDVQAVMQ